MQFAGHGSSSGHEQSMEFLGLNFVNLDSDLES